MRAALVLFLSLLLSGCSQAGLIEKGLSSEERIVIRGAIDDISRGDAASMTRKVPPEFAARIAPAMADMRRALPAPPLEVSVTNFDSVSGPDGRRAHAVYQVHGRSGWALVEATTQSNRGRTLLTGIFVQRVANDPRQLNSFSLRAANAAKILMLVAMVGALGTTIAGLIRVWRSGHFKRRWLWTIGCLVGLMTIKMNWTTGQTFFFPLSIHLVTVGATKQPIYAPWMLMLSFPAVAIIALLWRGHPDIDDAAHETDAADSQD